MSLVEGKSLEELINEMNKAVEEAEGKFADKEVEEEMDYDAKHGYFDFYEEEK